MIYSKYFEEAIKISIDLNKAKLAVYAHLPSARIKSEITENDKNYYYISELDLYNFYCNFGDDKIRALSRASYEKSEFDLITFFYKEVGYSPAQKYFEENITNAYLDEITVSSFAASFNRLKLNERPALILDFLCYGVVNNVIISCGKAEKNKDDNLFSYLYVGDSDIFFKIIQEHGVDKIKEYLNQATNEMNQKSNGKPTQIHFMDWLKNKLEEGKSTVSIPSEISKEYCKYESLGPNKISGKLSGVSSILSFEKDFRDIDGFICLGTLNDAIIVAGVADLGSSWNFKDGRAVFLSIPSRSYFYKENTPEQINAWLNEATLSMKECGDKNLRLDFIKWVENKQKTEQEKSISKKETVKEFFNKLDTFHSKNSSTDRIKEVSKSLNLGETIKESGGMCYSAVLNETVIRIPRLDRGFMRISNPCKGFPAHLIIIDSGKIDQLIQDYGKEFVLEKLQVASKEVHQTKEGFARLNFDEWMRKKHKTPQEWWDSLENQSANQAINERFKILNLKYQPKLYGKWNYSDGMLNNVILLYCDIPSGQTVDAAKHTTCPYVYLTNIRDLEKVYSKEELSRLIHLLTSKMNTGEIKERAVNFRQWIEENPALVLKKQDVVLNPEEYFASLVDVDAVYGYIKETCNLLGVESSAKWNENECAVHFSNNSIIFIAKSIPSNFKYFTNTPASVIIISEPELHNLCKEYGKEKVKELFNTLTEQIKDDPKARINFADWITSLNIKKTQTAQEFYDSITAKYIFPMNIDEGASKLNIKTAHKIYEGNFIAGVVNNCLVRIDTDFIEDNFPRKFNVIRITTNQLKDLELKYGLEKVNSLFQECTKLHSERTGERIDFYEWVLGCAPLLESKKSEDEPTEIDSEGTKIWKNAAGQIHRDGDLPAKEYKNGDKWWYQNDINFRANDLPTIVRNNGRQVWLNAEGYLNRLTGPAIINSNGDEEYWIRAKKYSSKEEWEKIASNYFEYWLQFEKNDPPNKIKDGIKYYNQDVVTSRAYDRPAEVGPEYVKWLKNGKRHRNGDKPALIWKDGTKCWFQNGKLSRLNGPAYIDCVGREEYWINGTHFSSKEEWQKEIDSIWTKEDPLPKQKQSAPQKATDLFFPMLAAVLGAGIINANLPTKTKSKKKKKASPAQEIEQVILKENKNGISS